MRIAWDVSPSNRAVGETSGFRTWVSSPCQDQVEPPLYLEHLESSPGEHDPNSSGVFLLGWRNLEKTMYKVGSYDRYKWGFYLCKMALFKWVTGVISPLQVRPYF